jgi:hypothetical protein
MIDPPSREALLDLAEKYEKLAELRRARARGEPIPERSVFKALAERFPGALRELDVLSLDLLDTRAASLRAALAGGPVEPWMAWMIGYHALSRAALRIRLRAVKHRLVSDGRAGDLAEDASSHAGVRIDEVFVRAVLRPPAGRIANVVHARLAAAFGAPSALIRAALIPRLREREAACSLEGPEAPGDEGP